MKNFDNSSFRFQMTQPTLTSIDLETLFIEQIQKQGPKVFARTFVGAHDEEEFIASPEEFLGTNEDDIPFVARSAPEEIENRKRLWEMFHHEQEEMFKRFYEKHLHELNPGHVARTMERLVHLGDISSRAVGDILDWNE